MIDKIEKFVEIFVVENEQFEKKLVFVEVYGVLFDFYKVYYVKLSVRKKDDFFFKSESECVEIVGVVVKVVEDDNLVVYKSISGVEYCKKDD